MKNRSAENEKSFGAELKRTKKQGNCSLFLYFLYLCINEVTKRVYFIGNERMLIAHDSNRLRFS